jgi:hypothetical protein
MLTSREMLSDKRRNNGKASTYVDPSVSRKRKQRGPLVSLGTQQSQGPARSARHEAEATAPESSTSQLGGHRCTERHRLGSLMF